MEKILIRDLGSQDYLKTWHDMRNFTETRTADQCDEFWLVEHPSIFTLGQNGNPEHLLVPNEIPVCQTDRGGQITYHGPGQLLVYTLVDVKRKQLTVRALVSKLENALIGLLHEYGITALARLDAPGVYVNGAKIASVGLRVKRGCSYHGLSLNVNMDLKPFSQINPCGHRGLLMTQLCALGIDCDMKSIKSELVAQLCRQFEYVEF